MVSVDNGIVLLTFDDGPNDDHKTTAELLDVLKELDVKAMFSLLGENVSRYPELTRRIFDEGHIIINHGYSDKWACAMKPEEFRENLKKGYDAITAALGKPPTVKLYRPQGGFYTAEEEKIWREEGWALVPGTIRTYDAVCDKNEKERVVRQTTRKAIAEGGGIIILHDGRDSHKKIEARMSKKDGGYFNREWIPSAVKEIIINLQKSGFVFDVSESF
ncbi:hypothetical protein FACS1894190_08050 [Spirochaetia bacterium]|nr:hypothetical protein FACS1894190_08050 [Spirochaetia bacterium]